jgi:phospholipid/cholesterol/gamma-HCH transport system substrate-binding protein
VRFQSLLGQNFIYVLDGNASERIRPGDEIPTEEGADLQKVISQLVGIGGKAETFLDELREKGTKALDQVNSIIEENRDNIRTTTQAFANAAPKIEALAANVDELVAGIQEGKGSLGKLVNDAAAYNNFTQVSADLKDILAKIKAGEGTIGKLVNDDDMHQELKNTFTNLGEAAREFRDTVGENREDVREFVEQLGGVGPKLRETIENARDISAKINEGQGTIGKLVNDPSLYNDLKRAVNQIGETFEGGEEQGVIRSFFGVLFGALL